MLSGGRVFLSTFDCTSASDPGSAIEAFDQGTGAPLWTRFVDAGAEGMVAYQGRVFVTASVSALGSTNGEVDVYDAATGSTVWSRNSRVCAVQDNATVVGQHLLFRACDADGTSHPRLVAAALGTGTPVWVRAGSWHAVRGDQPGTSARNLIAKAPDGRIADLDPATGATRWISSTAQTIGAVDSSRAYGTCATYAANDSTCAFRLTDGALLWRTFTDATGTTVAAVAGGVVYSGSSGLNATSGAFIRKLCSSGDTCPVLAVGDGRIVTRSAARLLDLYGRTGF
jgi:outer membrane protein assembly factor BamB